MGIDEKRDDKLKSLMVLLELAFLRLAQPHRRLSARMALANT